MTRYDDGGGGGADNGNGGGDYSAQTVWQYPWIYWQWKENREDTLVMSYWSLYLPLPSLFFLPLS